MEQYNSGNTIGFRVTGFHIGKDFITLIIKRRYKYKYSYNSCGKEHVEHMKQLAQQQNGLNAYREQHNPAYEWKVDMGGKAAA